MGKEEGISPEIQSLIEQNILHYRPQIEADSQTGFFIVNQLVIAFSLNFRVNPLPWMQQVFDKQGMDVEFVALPQENAFGPRSTFIPLTDEPITPDPKRFIIGFPHDPAGTYPYYLYVIVDRREEYFEKLAILGITPEQNIKRLRHTGLMRMISDTEQE